MRPVLSTTTYPQFTKFIFLVPVGWFSLETINTDPVSIKCLWEEANGWKRNSSGTRQRPGFLCNVSCPNTCIVPVRRWTINTPFAHTQTSEQNSALGYLSALWQLCVSCSSPGSSTARRNGRHARARNYTCELRRSICSCFCSYKGETLSTKKMYACDKSSAFSPLGCTPCCYLWTMACNVKCSVVSLQLPCSWTSFHVWPLQHMITVWDVTTTGSYFPVFF